MPNHSETGGLSVGERIERNEGRIQRIEEHIDKLRGEIEDMKIESAKNFTKLGVLIVVLTFLATLAGQFVMKRM